MKLAKSSTPVLGIIVVLLTLHSNLQAMWSVLEDDPRPRNPKHAFEVFSKDAWNRSNFATPQEMQWFRDAKYGMFVHFGLSTYKNAELSWGVCQVRKAPDKGAGPYPASEWTTWKDEFRIPEFDAKQLVQHAQDAGMKYIVVIAKHHDGFHMWDTKQSGFKVTNTPYGKDFLKEVADACHQAGMKFGIYYSQRDWLHPDYEPTNWRGEKHQRYIRYQNEAVRELCTNYGKVDVFWFDALTWGDMFIPEMWDAENLTRMIRKLQPGILINNRASLPGDFDTPEQKIGSFQNHRPWESCMCLCGTWSYSKTPTKSPKQLVDMLVSSLCGDGNMLLSWGPQWSGAFAPDQIASLTAVGDWVKKNALAIYGTRGGPWTPDKWGGSVYRDKSVFLHVKSLPPGNVLKLAGLASKVLKAGIHGGADVVFKQSGDQLEIALPDGSIDPLCTVIELTLDKPNPGILYPEKRKSLFEATEYGDVISDKATLQISSASQWDKEANHPLLFTGSLSGDQFAFHTQEETNPRAIIDLGKEHSIRGILIHNREGYPTRNTGVMVSMSLDGQTWEPVWTASDTSDIWEIPVTRFVAGAHIPGKDARYVKIERRLEKPDALHLQTVRIYGN
ncbi:MAG: alpha-L-fucosidase [Candidatus Methylacidiphilales bacterium]|nr:alpha-L-fucosidase [Candidatus Methylacidiphilales bacterium]